MRAVLTRVNSASVTIDGEVVGKIGKGFLILLGVGPDDTEKEPENDNTDNDGLDPDFKAAMDSYEKFMDEYVAFMKKYKSNPSDLALLADYADYVSKYAGFVENFEKWENKEMNAAETAYYIDVQARISKKLLEVAN